jgi:hypothetical protein
MAPSPFTSGIAQKSSGLLVPLHPPVLLFSSETR